MRYFVIWGICERGNRDELQGKGWKEGESEAEVVKEILVSGFEEGDRIDARYIEKMMKEWFGKEGEVWSYSDDWGRYVYGGTSKERVLDVWSSYLD